MFLHYNNKLVNVDTIQWVDCANYENHQFVIVHYATFKEKVANPEAIAVIMALNPAILEGKKVGFVRHSWAIHNLIGHPLMQIFTWLHLTKLALWIHDITVPEPKGNRE